MELDTEEIDYYKVLGCSIESSEEEIGRAVRKLSVKFHPDKNKAAEAAEIFLNIQKSKEFLLDPSKRKEYDEKLKKIRKRKEYDERRYQNMDSRRKRMREELEERLGKVQKPAQTQQNGAPTFSGSDNTHQSDKKRKKAELDRIRKDGLARMQEATMKQQKEHSVSIEEISRKLRERELEQSKQQGEDVQLQIKVKWKRSSDSHSDDSLASLFREFGPIDDISILPGKGASAVITFSSPNSAAAAVKAFEKSTTFRVSVYGEPKKASIFTHVYAPSHSTNQNPHFSNNSTVESDLMKEVKRTMEREALLQELLDEEKGISNSSKQHHDMRHIPSNGDAGESGAATVVYAAKDFQVNMDPVDLHARELDVLSKMRIFTEISHQ